MPDVRTDDKMVEEEQVLQTSCSVDLSTKRTYPLPTSENVTSEQKIPDAGQKPCMKLLGALLPRGHGQIL